MVRWMKKVMMMKRMKNKILFVPIVVMIIFLLFVTNYGQATTTRATTTTTTTTAAPNSTSVSPYSTDSTSESPYSTDSTSKNPSTDSTSAGPLTDSTSESPSSTDSTPVSPYSTDSTSESPYSPTTISAWTTDRPAVNLYGKMFTLTYGRGEISFYSPSFSPPSGTRPHTTTSTYPPWTTSSPYNGISVCLRYVTDLRNPSIFTLSPSTRPLKLGFTDGKTYILSFGYGNALYLAPHIRFWSMIGSEVWTRLCLTVDSRKNVVQVFSGPNMSIRKVLPTPYVWSGERVINFSGFDGQITDVQVWDYPLSYSEVYSYMNRYRPYSGSVLSWSHLSYSIKGNTLLEDVYQQQVKESINGRETEGEKKTRLFL